MDSFRKKELIFLVYIFFFALILRISYCFFFKENILYIQTQIFGDTQDYIQIAKNFLSGKGLISSPDRIAYRPPLYPLFLAGVYFLFGNGYWPIRIAQSILDALTCIMVYFLGRMVLNKRTGKVASFICAIYPFFIFFTGFELTETLFIFLLLVTVFLWLKVKYSSSIVSPIVTGIVSGLTILCRPSALLFVILSFVGLFFLWGKKEWHKLAILLVFTLLTISLWTVRNFYHFRKFIPLTTMMGSTLWDGNNPHSYGGPCEYYPEELKGLSEVERDRYLINATQEIIKENPLRFIKLMGRKFVRLWNIKPNSESFSSPLYNLVSFFSYVPVMITAIWGMFLTRKKWMEFLLFYLSFLSFTLVHMIFVGSIRYMVPVITFMIIFSSYTLSYIYNKIRK